jgi:uncharacterized protein YecE (DUF72 family)
MDARTMWRPVTRRGQRERGALLQMPPQPRIDARLSRFTSLLDTISEGERALDAAHRAVERNDPAQAERELSRFLSDARPVLEHTNDLPAEYVDLLGQTIARALVARAAAWIEHSFDQDPTAEALRKAARADVAEAEDLPPAWLDGKTQAMLGRLHRVLELAPA